MENTQAVPALRNVCRLIQKNRLSYEDIRLSKLFVRQKIPNLLTLLRMALGVSLLFLPLLSDWFLFVYLLAGLSDVLDGFLARRWGVESLFGARLDSAADFLLCVVLLVRFIPAYDWPRWAILWVIGIALVRLASLLVSFLRFKNAAFLHTIANKMTGFLLLCFPFFLRYVGLNITAFFLCVLASLSALEELLLMFTMRTFQPDRPTIFSK